MRIPNTLQTPLILIHTPTIYLQAQARIKAMSLNEKLIITPCDHLLQHGKIPYFWRKRRQCL